MAKPNRSSTLCASIAVRSAVCGVSGVEPEDGTPFTDLADPLTANNPRNQSVAVRVLERLGHRVHAFARRVGDMDAAECRPNGVVLRDGQMPRTDDLESTRRMRSIRAPAGHPHIIVMTAKAFAKEEAQCLIAAVDDLLSTPMRSEELVTALHRADASIGIV